MVKDWSEKLESKKDQLEKSIPKIEKLNLKELSKELPIEKRQNKSLFAQNLERQGKLKSHYNLSQVYQPTAFRQNEKIKKIEQHFKTIQTESRKQIITGEGLGNTKDVEQIHLENLELLSKMKPDEILQEKEKLMQQLDPKILAFIKRKNQTTETNKLEDKIEDSKEKRPSDEEIIEQLPFKPSKKWLHMDKIEYEKLEWMLKPKKLVEKEHSSSARFDFEGNLIAPDQEVPVTSALHHHGNQPELAGYTLDELFHLARSKFNQQRVLALQTLANILRKCQLGEYHDTIRSGEEENEPKENDKNNLLNQLIEGGILFLLRWSLDDQTESIINASLTAIKNLLEPNEQENSFDFYFDLNQGNQVPCLHPFSSIFADKKSNLKLDKNLNVDEEQELEDLKDNEFILQDLVRGLFRMNLMERIFYLLNKYQPTLSSNQIQHSVFCILFRCMRHSPELCYDFTEKYSNLLDLIVAQFLPSYIQSEQTDLENLLENSRNTLKLIRLISNSGPNMAQKLYKKYDLKVKITNYLTLDKYIKNSSVVKLQTEAIRLLKTLIFYSDKEMGIECVVDFYEILLTHFNSYLNNSKGYNEYLRVLIGLFDSLILTLTENDPNKEFKSEICSSVYSSLSNFMIKEFNTIFDNKKQEIQAKIDLNFYSICLNFMVDYLERMEHLVSLSKVDALSKKLMYLEILIDNLVEPIVNSKEKMNQLKFDQIAFSKMLPNSTSSSSGEIHEMFEKISGNNLSYLPTILSIPCKQSDYLSNSPFSFLAAFLRLYNLCFKLRLKLIDDKKFTNTRNFLGNSYLNSYLKAFMKNNNQTNKSTNNSYFLMNLESCFVYHCIKLAFNVFNFEVKENIKLLKFKI